MRRVVITAAGVVAPNAMCMEEFGSALKKGVSGLRVIDRFNPENFVCRVAGLVDIDDTHTLSARFPELKMSGDHKVLLGLRAFLEMYGSGLELYNCAINLGTSLESFFIEKIFMLSPGSFELDRYMAALPSHKDKPHLQIPLDFLGSLLKKHFNIKGSNYLNCSACTAGTQAMGHSFHMIRDGRYDRIITGGFDSMLNPLGLGGFAALGALSDDNELVQGAIRPFDLTRKGTILGEGAAMFLFEELESAKNRGAHILAEIAGYASTLDAYKISEPTHEGITAAMHGALSDAGISVDDVDYISAHGTGTPLNDSNETIAIKNVFGRRAYNIPVSSMKSMLGHLIGASGAVEIAGILCMIKDGFIPPTINLSNPDPQCDLDYVPGIAREHKVSVVLKNSMGFGGQNATIVLKRYQ